MRRESFVADSVQIITDVRESVIQLILNAAAYLIEGVRRKDRRRVTGSRDDQRTARVR
jgi:hypothetical protein